MKVLHVRSLVKLLFIVGSVACSMQVMGAEASVSVEDINKILKDSTVREAMGVEDALRVLTSAVKNMSKLNGEVLIPTVFLLRDMGLEKSEYTDTCLRLVKDMINSRVAYQKNVMIFAIGALAKIGASKERLANDCFQSLKNIFIKAHGSLENSEKAIEWVNNSLYEELREEDSLSLEEKTVLRERVTRAVIDAVISVKCAVIHAMAKLRSKQLIVSSMCSDFFRMLHEKEVDEAIRQALGAC